MLGSRVAAVLIPALLISCARAPLPPTPWTVRFGPVMGEEAIVGRVLTGRTAWIATAKTELVRIDVDGRRHGRHAIGPLAATEQLWGLAAAGASGLWTLIGFDTLAQMDGEGRVMRRVPLAERHVNVLTGHGDLLYQVVTFVPAVEALLAGPPGDAGRRPWGGMRTRDLALPRAQVPLINLVSCGSPAPGGIPCWFPDLPVVTITTAAGESRDVRLEGMRAADPRELLASPRPRRPVLDAFVTRTDGLWVLGSGEPSDENLADKPGGWLLARYTHEGRLVEQVQLPEPARMLLGVTDSSCLLLSWDGHVVEVRP